MKRVYFAIAIFLISQTSLAQEAPPAQPAPVDSSALPLEPATSEATAVPSATPTPEAAPTPAESSAPASLPKPRRPRRPGDENLVLVKAPTDIIENSSEANRINQQYMVTAQLLGAGPVSVSAAGIALGYYLDRNSILSLEYVGGSDDFTDGFDGHTKANAIGVHYKRFFGNSFYGKAGFDYRTVDYEFARESWMTPGTTLQRNVEGNSFALSTVIGNQWQWDNFTLGCDWFGVVLPLTSRTTRKDVIGSSDAYDQSRLNDVENEMLKSVQLQALRFYLGASF